MGITSADVTRLVGPLGHGQHKRGGVPCSLVVKTSRTGEWLAWLNIAGNNSRRCLVRSVDHLREIVEAFDRLGQAMKGA